MYRGITITHILEFILLLVSSNSTETCGDLSSYRRMWPMNITQSESTHNKYFIPVYANKEYNRNGSNITVVIVAIHGFNEAADFCFCTLLSALQDRGLEESVLAIVPWFFHQSISGNMWRNGEVEDTAQDTTLSNMYSLYWLGNISWISGGDAVINDGHKTLFSGVSSFDMLDSVYSVIVSSDQFPLLSRVVYLGFSAGGQMIHRYAWATTHSLFGTVNKKYNVKIRYIISDPSSYLYFSSDRPNSSCIPLRDTGVNLSCTEFITYSSNQASLCPRYNTWKYGLIMEELHGYSYLATLAKNDTLRELHTASFRERDVRFVLGSHDSCNCQITEFENSAHCQYGTDSSIRCSANPFDEPSTCCDTYPDSFHNHLLVDCSSNAQGTNRLQRGLVYMGYLKWYWQEYAYIPVFKIVKGMKHDMNTFLRSDAIYIWAFNTTPLYGVDKIRKNKSNTDRTNYRIKVRTFGLARKSKSHSILSTISISSGYIFSCIVIMFFVSYSILYRL